MKQTPINTSPLACQVSLHSLDSTSVYGLELLVLEGTGGKAPATGHREICTYFQELFYKSNRALFPCLPKLILTLGGLLEFSRVMQILDYVSGITVLNSSNIFVFRWGYVNTEKVLYCLILWHLKKIPTLYEKRKKPRCFTMEVIP